MKIRVLEDEKEEERIRAGEEERAHSETIVLAGQEQERVCVCVVSD